VVMLNYVSPDARFKGVSKALLARLESKAAELGLAQCSLSSTKTARNFYRAMGYREQQSPEANACISMVKKFA
jgi:N-acetylglutamate synthase-like GNAT family acetyltransferase